MSFPVIAVSAAVFLLGYLLKQGIPMLAGIFLLLLGIGIMSPLDIMAGVGAFGYKVYQDRQAGKKV